MLASIGTAQDYLLLNRIVVATTLFFCRYNIFSCTLLSRARTTPPGVAAQDKAVHKLKEVLTTEGMREAGFPTKVSLPLYLGVYAAITFDNCKVFKPGELQPELFLVNPQYSSSRRMRKVSVFCRTA